MENSWAVVLLAFLLIPALAFISKILFKQHPVRKPPPGPKPWPIIGNLNLIGSIPHQSFHSLSQKYGEIMLLKFGKFPVVVVSSLEMAKQFLRTHDAIFASRPPLAAGKYTGYNNKGMTWAPYGPYWRQARKISATELINAKKLDSLEHIRKNERHKMFAHLFSLSGTPVVLRDHLLRCTLSAATRMLLTNDYFDESKHENAVVKRDELLGMFDEWFFLNGVLNIGDWIPWLSFLDLQGYVKKMKALTKKFDRFFDYVIDDHLIRMAAEKNFSPKDMVDVLLQMTEDPDPEVRVTKDGIKGLLQDLMDINSGPAVEWAIHEILRQPRIIEKAKEELDKVVGRNRWVEENDLSQLPYIDAIIMETMRLHPLGTLLVPHYASQDCKIAGYGISKGTMVLINAWSIGRDPHSWDAPGEFLPERFMGKDIDIIDVLTKGNFALLPFGLGRRSCPGYGLALKIVRTMLANLLHGFKLRLVDGMRPEDICMEERYGISTHPKEALAIIMEPTLPFHLY